MPSQTRPAARDPHPTQVYTTLAQRSRPRPHPHPRLSETRRGPPTSALPERDSVLLPGPASPCATGHLPGRRPGRQRSRVTSHTRLRGESPSPPEINRGYGLAQHSRAGATCRDAPGGAEAPKSSRERASPSAGTVCTPKSMPASPQGTGCPGDEGCNAQTRVRCVGPGHPSRHQNSSAGTGLVPPEGPRTRRALS